MDREDPHLGDEQLLLHADGELTEPDSQAVREHLAACWTCRARIDELQATINTLARFRNEVLLPGAPPPPEPWPGLAPRLETLAGQLHRRSVLDRSRQILRPFRARAAYARPSGLLSSRRAVAIAAAVVVSVWLGTDTASAGAARGVLLRFTAFVTALVRRPAPEPKPRPVVASRPAEPIAIPPAPPPAPTPKALPAPPAIAIEVLDNAELDVRLALQETGADLLPRLELHRTPRRIELRGPISEPLRTTLAERFAGNALVAVPLPAATATAADTVSDASPAFGLLSWRLRTFRDAAAGEAALRDIHQLTVRVQRRAEAYHAVAARFEAAAADQLSDIAAPKFKALVRANHHELVTDVDRLDRELAVLIGWTPRRLLEQDIRTEWRGQARAASDVARALSEAVRALVTVPDLPPSSLESASEPADVSRVRRSLATLWQLFERS
jgi:anti-sigma factor RsiW